MLQGSKIILMAEIYVKLEPDRDEFGIEPGTITEIQVESKAENGRANAELVRRLEEILGQKPGIVSGHRSRRKKITIDMEKDRIMEELEKHG